MCKHTRACLGRIKKQVLFFIYTFSFLPYDDFRQYMCCRVIVRALKNRFFARNKMDFLRKIDGDVEDNFFTHIYPLFRPHICFFTTMVLRCLRNFVHREEINFKISSN